MALILLFTVNLPRYISAQPGTEPLKPDPKARYKVTFNETERKVELRRVEDEGLELDSNQKPLYQLCKGLTGKWKVKEAREDVSRGGFSEFNWKAWRN
ncbi:hypothetical protein IE53DRAFT_385682, partial [Violaceomyces palustris]